jgi:hypothetical protein
MRPEAPCEIRADVIALWVGGAMRGADNQEVRARLFRYGARDHRRIPNGPSLARRIGTPWTGPSAPRYDTPTDSLRPTWSRLPIWFCSGWFGSRHEFTQFVLVFCRPNTDNVVFPIPTERTDKDRCEGSGSPAMIFVRDTSCPARHRGAPPNPGVFHGQHYTGCSGVIGGRRGVD